MNTQINVDELFGNGNPIDWTQAYRDMAERYAKASGEADKLREHNARLVEALDGLALWAKVAADAHHAGIVVLPETWSMLYKHYIESCALLAEIGNTRASPAPAESLKSTPERKI